MAFGKPNDDKSMGMGSTTYSPTSTPSAPTSSSGSSLGAFLGNGSKVVGQLTFTGPVEVDGEIEGEIAAQDKLTIGESAFVKGTVQGGEILVKGRVQGDIIASKKLVLKKPAKILGNISTPSLNIEDGVTFDGKCTMNGGGASASKSPSKNVNGASSAVDSAGKSAAI